MYYLWMILSACLWIFRFPKLNSTSWISLSWSKKPLFVQLCTVLYNFLKMGFHVASNTTLFTLISAAKAKRRKVSHHQVKSKNLISTQYKSKSSPPVSSTKSQWCPPARRSVARPPSSQIPGPRCSRPRSSPSRPPSTTWRSCWLLESPPSPTSGLSSPRKPTRGSPSMGWDCRSSSK